MRKRNYYKRLGSQAQKRGSKSRRGNVNKYTGVQNADGKPFNYTNLQKWQIYYKNGRRQFYKNCLLLCDVWYEREYGTFWMESHSHIPGEHAEIRALERVASKEREYKSTVR